MAKSTIKREHFISIVGFYGNTFLVDKKLAARIKKTDAESLLQKGLFFSAVCLGLFELVRTGSDAASMVVRDYFKVDDFDVLVRRFGAHQELLNDFTGFSMKFI